MTTTEQPGDVSPLEEQARKASRKKQGDQVAPDEGTEPQPGQTEEKPQGDQVAPDEGTEGEPADPGSGVIEEPQDFGDPSVEVGGDNSDLLNSIADEWRAAQEAEAEGGEEGGEEPPPAGAAGGEEELPGKPVEPPLESGEQPVPAQQPGGESEGAGVQAIEQREPPR